MRSGEVRDVELLAFIWGAIFAGGVFAAVQYAVLWLSWGDPPTLADLVGTLVFAALAVALLTPALFVLNEVVRGRFAGNVAKAREEREGGRLRRVSFRVRRRYFDLIVAGEKTREVRRASPYWLRIAHGLRDDDAGPCGVAVFVCGRDVHRREIVGVSVYDTAEEALGRRPSEQGTKDLGTGPVLGFDLGRELA